MLGGEQVHDMNGSFEPNGGPKVANGYHFQSERPKDLSGPSREVIDDIVGFRERHGLTVNTDLRTVQMDPPHLLFVARHTARCCNKPQRELVVMVDHQKKAMATGPPESSPLEAEEVR